MWIDTPSWKWLKPFILRSTSVPIEDVLKLNMKETKEKFFELEKEKKAFALWCDNWIQNIRSLPLSKDHLSQQRKVIQRIKKKNPLTELDIKILNVWGMVRNGDEYTKQQQLILELEGKARTKFLQELDKLQRELEMLFSSSTYEMALYTLNHKLWRFHSRNRLIKESHSFSERRQKCRTIFAYIQRVTTKNDTFGEFGPISYGAFGKGTPNYNRTVTKKKVFIAHQGLQKLLTTIKKDLKLSSENWKLPTSAIDGLKILQNYIKENKHPKAKKWRDILNHLEDIIHDYHHANSPDEKDKAMVKAEELFTSLTKENYQGKFQQYFADKALMYEECYDEVFLPVILDSCLWKDLDNAMIIQAKLRLEVWKRWQIIAVKGFEQIAKGKSSIPFMSWISFWFRNPPSFEKRGMIEELKPWLIEQNEYYSISIPQDILQLWEKEIESFRWLFSPDLMIKGVHESNGVRVSSIIIGELHHGFTADGWMFYFHPDKEKIKPVIHKLMPRKTQNYIWANWIFKRTMKSTPQEYPGVAVEIQGTSGAPTTEVFTIKDLEVRLIGSKVAVYIKGTETPLCFYPPALGFRDDTFFPFGVFCPPMIEPNRLLDKGRHKSLKVGRVTIARETWRFEPKDWIGENTTTDWFLQAKRLFEVQRKYKLPRIGYLRFSHEQKPIWFDFDNPFSIDLFFNLVKEAEWFLFSKMDPEIEELILEDIKGHYCCELRTFIFRKEMDN